MIGRRGGGGFRLGALLFGFAFLYLPIALLVVYSFNGSRLVTVGKRGSRVRSHLALGRILTVAKDDLG